MQMPRSIRTAIIWRQVWTNAVHRVINPKQKVIQANQVRGPNHRTATVQGSWKTTVATVKMKIDTEYRWPFRSRSSSNVVTDADARIPESSRLRLHRIPAMEQSRRSAFRRILDSRCSHSAGIDGPSSLLCSDVAGSSELTVRAATEVVIADVDCWPWLCPIVYATK